MLWRSSEAFTYDQHMSRLPLQVLVYISRRASSGAREYLLLRRVPENGGFWQGVSGGVEEGETFEQAARREVFEETGYRRFVRFAPLDFRYTFPLDRPRWGHLYAPDVETISEECFGAEVRADEGEPRIDPREHDEYRWLGFDEALAHLTWEENKDALRRFATLP